MTFHYNNNALEGLCVLEDNALEGLSAWRTGSIYSSGLQHVTFHYNNNALEGLCVLEDNTAEGLSALEGSSIYTVLCYSDNVLKGLSVLGDWLVVLGENDQNETEAGEQFFSVEEIFVVPEYNCGYNESETKRGPERSCRINTKGCQLAPEGCHTRTKIKT